MQVAVRYDHYDEEAGQPQVNGFSTQSVTCASLHHDLQPSDFNTPCPGPLTAQITSGRTVQHSTTPTISLRWQVQEDVALRASYAEGFLPPLLDQLTPQAPLVPRPRRSVHLAFTSSM